MAAAASTARTVVRPAWLVVDFDGTCTLQDTTPLLPKLAEMHTQRPTAAIFAELEHSYLAGLSDVLSPFQLDVDGATGGALDVGGLTEYLAAMDEHSARVTAQVGFSGCLAGIRPTAIAETLTVWASSAETAALCPQLREGCAACLAAAAANDCSLGVLSINWCHALIEVVLAPTNVPLAEIWSNELDTDGRIQLRVAGAAEKRAQIRVLMDDDSALDSDGAQRRSVVYVGDSATDFTALLEADIGILVGNSGSARRIGRRYGLQFEPLARFDELADRTAPGVIWEAAHWAEITALLFGFGSGC